MLDQVIGCLFRVSKEFCSDDSGKEKRCIHNIEVIFLFQGETSLLISTYQKNLLEQKWDFIQKNLSSHSRRRSKVRTILFLEL